MMQERLHTDLLVIGTGVAGATAALTAADEGARVLVLTKEQDLAECNTRYAQGGIIAEGPDDSPDLLYDDVLRAGAGLSWPDAVSVLAHEGPPLVRELLVERLAVDFDRNEAGELHCTGEAAHSRRRIFHCKDATGRAIEERLMEALEAHPRITIRKRATVIDLVTEGHHSADPLAIYGENPCMGAYVWDGQSQGVWIIHAQQTILATGGLGQVFLHTTNCKGATGDGLAMAARAGARIINGEYVQFHPTALYHRDADRFLISEAVRGEGGQLFDHEGRRFMKDHAPDELELAPRDVVARAIHQEMERSGRSCVFLDIAHHATAGLDVAARFPTIHASCLRFGIDITREPIPVVPAAHYFCGGIAVDLHGRSSIPRLHAVGECACTGVHGANRLASTSLLEGLVWGRRAALRSTAVLREGPALEAKRFEAIPDWNERGLSEVSDPTLVRQDWIDVKNTMWNYAGIARTAKRLNRATEDMGYLFRRVDDFYRSTRLSREIIELRNGILAARLIIAAALRNETSRGCHFRRT